MLGQNSDVLSQYAVPLYEGSNILIIYCDPNMHRCTYNVCEVVEYTRTDNAKVLVNSISEDELTIQ